MKNPLDPSPQDMLARARADLRLGLAVVVDDWLVAAAETVAPARLAAMLAGGQAELALTARRAATLKIAAYDGDLVRLVLPGDLGAAHLRALADPSRDLDHPLKGPLRAQRDGSPIPARAAISLLKQAELLPAAILCPATGSPANLTHLDAAMALNDAPAAFSPVAAASLPTALAGRGRLHVFRATGGSADHYAFEIGQPARDRPVLARLHSACFTGDVLGSRKCDCGPQLHAALAQMGAAGGGVLLYLNQEGRGIGLANKMRAYALQDQGFDTVEANHRLGFEDDERDFRIGAGLLKTLGFSQIRLLTNNPRKLDMLASHGLTVTDRVPLRVGETPENRAYLATKAAKSGHLMTD
ncbi:GTP cyclohydrolase II [Paracoccus sp. p4-l81]|uniref:GTP cyclohydrolase II n=1 Tax=unclassified Paracoccus (in: a-proteobacteria) TaxID=2688777 RepID=UPI0035B7FF55